MVKKFLRHFTVSAIASLAALSIQAQTPYTTLEGARQQAHAYADRLDNMTLQQWIEERKTHSAANLNKLSQNPDLIKNNSGAASVMGALGTPPPDGVAAQQFSQVRASAHEAVDMLDHMTDSEWNQQQKAFQ